LCPASKFFNFIPAVSVLLAIFPYIRTCDVVRASCACRSDTQCREKWASSLDPTVSAAPYSAEEDAQLLAVVAALQRLLPGQGSAGNTEGDNIAAGGGQDAAAGAGKLQGMRWAKVAQYMPGRTDASVRSRYFVLQRQMGKRKREESAAAGEDAVGKGRRKGRKILILV
jgi:hypothetical protein